MCSWAQRSDPTLSGTFQHGTRCSWAQQSDPIQSDTCLHCTSCSWPPQSVRLQSGTCQASTKSSCRPWSGLSHAGIRHSDAQRGCVLILKLHKLACLMHQYILAALCIVAYYLILRFPLRFKNINLFIACFGLNSDIRFNESIQDKYWRKHYNHDDLYNKLKNSVGKIKRTKLLWTADGNDDDNNY